MKSKRSRARFIGRIVVFGIGVILIFALLCGLGSGALFLSTRLHGFSFPDTYTYKIGMDSTSQGRLKSHTYKIGSVDGGDTLYINFTVLLEYCGFYESGDRHEYRYTLPGDDSGFVVTDGSAQVNINGNIIYMEAPAIVSEGALYLPLSFVDHYIDGISIEHQTKTVTDEETGKEEKIEEPLIYIVRCNEKNEYALLLEENKPCQPIDTSALH